jgi:hypothetical protein
MLVFLMSILIGMGIGQSQVYAESKGVWVDPVGMVGTALTTGHPTTGGSVGRSSSGIMLYWLRAYTRIWHTGPILQASHDKWLVNTTLAQTNSLTSIGYGDYAATRHEFQYISIKPASITYTSDTGVRSCYAAWNTFVYNC